MFDKEYANQGSQCSSVQTYTLVVPNVALYQLGGARRFCMFFFMVYIVYNAVLSVWMRLLRTYIVHYLNRTGLCHAPLTCIVYPQPALCTMVHKWDLFLWEVGVTPDTRRFCMFVINHSWHGTQYNFVSLAGLLLVSHCIWSHLLVNPWIPKRRLI